MELVTEYRKPVSLSSDGNIKPLDRKHGEQMNIIRCLSNAIEANELFLEYQPKVNREGRVLSFEALLRWRSKELGLIPPGVFIPIAEQLGWITEFTCFAFEHVCREIRYWQKTYTRDRVIPVAINLSTIDVEQTNFAKSLIKTAKWFNVSPKHIILELTESLATQRIDQAKHNVSELRNNGFKVSLDDFGTGHSGLSKLLQFEVDEVKIDRKFVNNIESDVRKRKLCSAILATCKSIDVSTVVEGVESKKQLDTLVELGFDTFQGFGFAKPLSRQVLEQVYKDKKEFFFTPELLSKEDVQCSQKKAAIYLSRN